jgi:hypothetical protein
MHKKAKFATVMLLSATLSGSLLAANETQAMYFLAMATGSVPLAQDPRVLEVSRQLDAVETACAASSTGAGFHDKLVKAHSLMHVQQSLTQMLSDFVPLTRAQCRTMSDVDLLTLYVLERNHGAPRIRTLRRLEADPTAVRNRWFKR